MSDRTPQQHADTVRGDTIRSAFRYAAGIHHPGCNTRLQPPQECHCYLRSQLPAEAALDALLADVERLTAERDEALGESGLILVALGEPCAECGHVDWRADDERIDSYRNALAAAETLAERYRAVLKSDGHGSPSFHMSTCPGCAALRDEVRYS